MRVCPRATIGLATVALASCTQSAPAVLVVVDPSSGQTLGFSTLSAGLSANFTGDYFSPQTGTLHLEQRGQRVSGHYHDVHDDCVVDGSVVGWASGRRTELEWSEHEVCPGGASLLAGHAELVLDPGPGASQPVRLFGRRALQVTELVTHHGQTTRVEHFAPDTPWIAVSLACPVVVLPQGSGQLGPTSAASPDQLATRFEIVSRALARVDAPAQVPGRAALLQAQRRACLALTQANEAVNLWRSGDPRRFLQVEYCVGQATAQVAHELSVLDLAAPGGLLGVAPEDPPSTWSDASCPPGSWTGPVVF